MTHQLLAESSSQIIPVGNDRDFWVVEGLACYLESFQVLEDGTVSVGNIDHPRMQAARRQLVEDGEYELLERFCLMGRLKFQQGERPTLQIRYAQASDGLAHFFMNYEDGQYKDGFIEFLSQLYSPDQRVRSKANRSTKSWECPRKTSTSICGLHQGDGTTGVVRLEPAENLQRLLLKDRLPLGGQQCVAVFLSGSWVSQLVRRRGVVDVAVRIPRHEGVLPPRWPS